MKRRGSQLKSDPTHAHPHTHTPIFFFFFLRLVISDWEAMSSYRSALDTEKELFKTLAEKEPTFAGISHYLSLLVLRWTISYWFCRGFVAPLTLSVLIALAGSVELARMLYFKTSKRLAPSMWNPGFGMRISKSTAGSVNYSPA